MFFFLGRPHESGMLKPAYMYPLSSIISILRYLLYSLQRALILLATNSQLLGLVLMRYSSSRLAGL
jgi:hypothetical protein